jgi:anti-sigma factor RsiW
VSCDNVRPLLHGFADGELDLVRSLEVEQHLAGCPACAASLRRVEALRTALQDAPLYHRAPDALRGRVRAALRRQRRSRGVFPGLLGRALAAAAVLALVALSGWGAARWWAGAPAAGELLAREALGDHLRSLQQDGALLAVTSSDRHTVKPWFAGRLNFSPPVKDLADHGFALAGGRVDYLDGRPAAALVYRRRQHVVTLLVQPNGADAVRAPRAQTRQGYHVLHWAEGGLAFWAVSDLNEGELQDFAALVRQ